MSGVRRLALQAVRGAPMPVKDRLRALSSQDTRRGALLRAAAAGRQPRWRRPPLRPATGRFVSPAAVLDTGCLLVVVLGGDARHLEAVVRSAALAQTIGPGVVPVFVSDVAPSDAVLRCCYTVEWVVGADDWERLGTGLSWVCMLDKRLRLLRRLYGAELVVFVDGSNGIMMMGGLLEAGSGSIQTFDRPVSR